MGSSISKDVSWIFRKMLIAEMVFSKEKLTYKYLERHVSSKVISNENQNFAHLLLLTDANFFSFDFVYKCLDSWLAEFSL